MRRRTHLAALAVTSLALAACGTRVNLSGTNASVGSGLNSLSGGLTGTTPSAISPALSSGATTGSDQTTVAASTAPQTSPTTGSSTYVPPSATTGVIPLHTKTITIGAWVADQSINTVAKSMGLSALQTGNQTNQVKALASDINAHGGIDGAKIALVIHATGASSGSADSEQQAVCDQFTQDNHVNFAISINGASSEVLAKCLASRGVPFVDDDYQVDQSFIDSLRHLFFLPSDWTLDRLMRTQVDALNGLGFFGTPAKPNKVGILLYGTPQAQRVLQQTVIPRLAALGVKNPDTYALKADGTDYEAESNVVIKFRSDNVTRIFAIAVSPLGFMLNAQQQGYYPKYGVYSTDGPAALLQGTAPKRQLQGSVGFGWSPPYDVDAQHDPGPVSANETRCLTLMKNAGEDVSSGTVRALVLWMCDAFWFIQKAVETSHDSSPAGLILGAREMRGYSSPVTWRTDLSSGRQDGAAAYRDLAFDDGCSCYVYTSGLKPASS